MLIVPSPKSLISARMPAQVALYYRIFFLYVEPVTALIGFIAAAFYPSFYLSELTPSAPLPATLDTATLVSLRQLANLYLLFAFNETFILRATNDLRVWRTLVLGMLIADFGHLATLTPLGLGVFWKVTSWGLMEAGHIAFVYMGAATRTCFLLGVGSGKKKSKKAPKDVGAEPVLTKADMQRTPAHSTRSRNRKM
jgi:hypothetical protein